MVKYVQDFLPHFLEAEAEAREQMIDETTRQVHLAREFIRYDKMVKLSKNENTRKYLERAKQEILKLMERQRS